MARASNSDKWLWIQDGSTLGLVTSISYDRDKNMKETGWMNPTSDSYWEPGKKTKTLSIDAFIPRIYTTGETGYKEVCNKYESDVSIAWQLKSLDTSIVHTGIGWVKSISDKYTTDTNASFSFQVQIDGSTLLG